MLNAITSTAAESTEARHGRYQAWRRPIGWWLVAVALMVFLMVVVGGVTRLTESGLSIVEWKPVSGIVPPMSQDAWQAEFRAYQATPEYKLINRGMSLDEFKSIFWWEFGHRLLGRLIGFVFAIPFLYFLWRKAVPRDLAPRLAVLFLLGGAQGAVGWWMVKSGLVSEPDVSQYRLAAHLSLALLIFAGLVWTALDLLTAPRRTRPAPLLRRLSVLLLVLVSAQIVLGALVAGTNAGFAYNSWPLIDGRFIPSGLWEMTPWYLNISENTLTIQFDHRMMAYLITLLALLFWGLSWRLETDRRARILAFILLMTVLAQVALGIWALLAVVPIDVGAAHQAGAVVLLGVVLAQTHRQKTFARMQTDEG